MDGVFDCQILNYLSLNCTNDIHEDLLDFNMQLIHCTKTGLCLSDLVSLRKKRGSHMFSNTLQIHSKLLEREKKESSPIYFE